jgi:hypothetical protein
LFVGECDTGVAIREFQLRVRDYGKAALLGPQLPELPKLPKVMIGRIW